MQHCLQGKRTGNTIHQGEHIAAKANLQLRMLVEFIQYNLRDRILLEVNDDIDTTTVSSIVNSRNFWQFLVAHQIGDLFERCGISNES